MVLIVTYDLKASRDYAPFYEALKLQGQWWHYLTNTWLIDTSKTPQEVVAAVRPHMDQNDSLLVALLAEGQPTQGWLPKLAWDWINERVGAKTPPLPFPAAVSAMHAADK